MFLVVASRAMLAGGDLVRLFGIHRGKIIAKCPQVAEGQQHLIADLLLEIKTPLVEIAGDATPLKILRGLDNFLTYGDRAIAPGLIGRLWE